MKKLWMLVMIMAILCGSMVDSCIADSPISVIHLPEGETPKFEAPEETKPVSTSVPSFSEPSAPTASSIRPKGYDAATGEYQYVYFGKYEQTRGGQPILWRVLTVEENDALLLSERILTTMSYGFSNDWEQSQIRKWLNGVFIKEAFSSDERKAIYNSESLGQVFILSQAELSNQEYGFMANAERKDTQRCSKGTTLAVDHGLFVNQDNQCSTYYTRTVEGRSLVSVTSEGKFGVAKVSRDDVGVRPAIWVNLKEIHFTEGDGTIQNPYQ